MKPDLPFRRFSITDARTLTDIKAPRSTLPPLHRCRDKQSLVLEPGKQLTAPRKAGKKMRFLMAKAAVIGVVALLSACGGNVSERSADYSDTSVGGGEVYPANVEWGDLDVVDQRLFTVMAEVDETFRSRAAEVWSDDFRMDQTPIVFARRDLSYEVTAVYVLHNPVAAALPGAERVALDESLGLGYVYRIDPPENIGEYDGPGTSFDFDVDVGGTSSMLFFLDEGDSDMLATTWEYARFVVHETFHRYQMIDAQWSEQYPDYGNYPRDAENAALALLEDRVLGAMSKADDPGEIRRRLDQFLAIREARSAAVDLGNLEDTQELAEGAARYVENRYAEVNGRPGGWATGAPVEEMEGSAAALLAWLEFERFYSSGGQIGWALDELGVDWKQAAAQGVSPADLAAREFPPADRSELIKEAKVEFGYDELVDVVERADFESYSPEIDSENEAKDLIQCLTDQGVTLGTEVDPAEGLDALLDQLDANDPAVAEGLEACGWLWVPIE